MSGKMLTIRSLTFHARVRPTLGLIPYHYKRSIFKLQLICTKFTIVRVISGFTNKTHVVIGHVDLNKK